MFKLIILREKIREFFREEDGASAIEYTIIAALLAAILVTAMGTLGTSIEGAFTYISGVLNGVSTPSGGGGGTGGQ